ncbi:MAG: hypothetical protein MZW92_03955 [Comamonadaceae bacterium]|nr:hypothetical protein [Comamonadaceae bacterium]
MRRTIDLDVLMASAAIPFIFPAARIDRRPLRRRRDAPARAVESRPCTSAPTACWSSARAPMQRRAPADGGAEAAAEPRSPARLRARFAVHRRAVDRHRAPAPDQPT